MGGTLWVALVAAGMGLMWAMRYTHKAILDAVMIRAAASCYMGAGIIGAGGWLGRTTTAVVGWVSDLGASVGSAALGTSAVWIIWSGLGLMWVLTMLPEKIFAKPIPDWLAYSGLLIPSFAGSIPGPLGQSLRWAIGMCGRLMIGVLSGLIGA